MALRIAGVVLSVHMSEPTAEYPRPGAFVNVEGLTVIAGEGVALPEVGDEILGTCNVTRREGKPPVVRLLHVCPAE